MREILFRGKRDKRYGEGWTYGVPYIDHEGDCIMATHCSKRVVDPETVGQYTGLTDKNGKKIFEGDIVEMPAYAGGKHKTVVYFKDGKFAVNGSNYHFKDIKARTVKVIGNIHDNPELLEVQNEQG